MNKTRDKREEKKNEFMKMYFSISLRLPQVAQIQIYYGYYVISIYQQKLVDAFHGS